MRRSAWTLGAALLLALPSAAQEVVRVTDEKGNPVGFRANPRARLDVTVDGDKLKQGLERFRSETTEAKRTLKDLDELDGRLARFKEGLLALNAALVQAQGRPGAEQQAIVLQPLRAWSLAVDELAKLIASDADLQERVQNANVQAGPGQDILAGAAAVLKVASEYATERRRELDAQLQKASLPVSLVIRLERTTRQVAPLGAALMPDAETQDLLNNAGSALLPGSGPNRTTPQQLQAAIEFQLGTTEVRARYAALKGEADALLTLIGNADDQTARTLKASVKSLADFVKGAVDALNASADSGAGVLIGNAANFVSATAPQAVLERLEALQTALLQQSQPLKDQGGKVKAAAEDLIRSINNSLDVARQFFRVGREYVEISTVSRKLNLEDLKPQNDILATYDPEGREVSRLGNLGDRVTLEVVTTVEGRTQPVGERKVVHLYDRGLWRSDEAITFLGVPTRDRRNTYPGVGYVGVFHPQPRSGRGYEAPSFGFGPMLSAVNFDGDDQPELGIGLALSLLDDRLFVGGGYSTGSKTPFLFAGFRIFRIKF